MPFYFVEPPGDEGWLDGELVEGELGYGELDGSVDEGGVVEGEADGVRSPGRSPMRSLRDSPQPAIKVARAIGVPRRKAPCYTNAPVKTSAKESRP